MGTNDDIGYELMSKGQIDLLLEVYGVNGLLVKDKLVELVRGCLCVEETQRFEISDVVKHEWFRKYYLRHNKKMEMRIKNEKLKGDGYTDGDVLYYKPQKMK